jgi:hypothetical protein
MKADDRDRAGAPLPTFQVGRERMTKKMRFDRGLGCIGPSGTNG